MPSVSTEEGNRLTTFSVLKPVYVCGVHVHVGGCMCTCRCICICECMRERPEIDVSCFLGHTATLCRDKVSPWIWSLPMGRIVGQWAPGSSFLCFPSARVTDGYYCAQFFMWVPTIRTQIPCLHAGMFLTGPSSRASDYAFVNEFIKNAHIL